MKKIITVTLLLLPAITSAQQLRDINTIAQKASYIGNLFIALIISLSVIWIIYNIFRYMVAGTDSSARKEGGMHILYGVIGLFVMLSIWGLVYILINSFVFPNTQRPDYNNIRIPDPTLGGRI